MPSNRRVKVNLAFAILALIILFYVATSPSKTRSNPFYTSTRDALAQREAEEAAGKSTKSGDVPVQTRLKEAAEKARAAAEKKGAEFHGADVKSKSQQIKADIKGTGEDGVARKNLRGGSEKVIMEAKDRIDRERERKEEEEKNESPEEHKAEEELNYILKRSPIIIFSKTYCPFSRKAKDILLTKYKITPVPHVVELDEHPLGQALQAQLAKNTGRRTVPNVLINGKSIGGGDDIEELHTSGTLITKISSLAGKRVQINQNKGRR